MPDDSTCDDGWRKSDRERENCSPVLSVSNSDCRLCEFVFLANKKTSLILKLGPWRGDMSHVNVGEPQALPAHSINPWRVGLP